MNWPSRSRRPLPLAAIPIAPTPRTCTIDYGMSTMDSRGRIISDHVIAAVLRWVPGTTLTAAPTEDHGLVVRPDPGGGEMQVTPSGHLRLPAAIRHHCHLRAGDRLLLVADPDASELRLYPPTVLDDLIGHHGTGASR